MRILFLTDTLAEGLARRGHTVTSPREGAERSGILCFRHRDIPSETLIEHLLAAGVVASLRDGSVRLSPHIYNSEEEIERFFELLERKGA